MEGNSLDYRLFIVQKASRKDSKRVWDNDHWDDCVRDYLRVARDNYKEMDKEVISSEMVTERVERIALDESIETRIFHQYYIYVERLTRVNCRGRITLKVRYIPTEYGYYPDLWRRKRGKKRKTKKVKKINKRY